MPLIMPREASSSIAALFAWFLMSVNVVPGGGHTGTFDGGVGIALADVRGGFRGVLGHVTHAVEGVFAVCRRGRWRRGHRALFTRHLIVAVRGVEDVVEAAVGLAEGEKIFCQVVAAFHETAVVQRNPQLAEGDYDLRDGFDVRRAPRRR